MPPPLEPPPSSDQPDAGTADWRVPSGPAAAPNSRTITNGGGSTPGPYHADRQTRSLDTARLGPGGGPPGGPSAPGMPEIPGYRMERLIGTGGMGRVYLVECRKSKRLEALKIISVGARDGDAVRARHDREVQALAAFDHPNIVSVYHSGEWGGEPFLTMRYVPGGTLVQNMAAVRADRGRAVGLVTQIAQAVQHLHDHGVLHRDLKPGNILLEDDGRPLVADFGLVRWLDDDSDLTGTGNPVGTRAYMSPEQTFGKKAAIGPASDVWSLGVILYELLTGDRPFVDADPLELFRRIRHADLPPLPADVPPDLTGVVSRCLAKKPADRYASATALAADLEAWQAGRPVTAPPRLPVPSTTWRWAWGAVGLIALSSAYYAARPAGPATLPTAISDDPPAHPLRSPADLFAAGETVVLIGPTDGPRFPVASPPGWAGHMRAEPNAPFEFASRETGLLRLADCRPTPGSRLEADIDFERPADARQRSMAGLYVGLPDCPVGTNTFRRVLAFGRNHRNAPGAGDAVENVGDLTFLAWHDREPVVHQVMRRTGPHATAPGDGRPDWVKLALVFEPAGVRVSWNGRPAADLPAEEYFRGELARFHKFFPAATPTPAPWPTQFTVGLFVQDAVLRVRNVRLVPSPLP